MLRVERSLAGVLLVCVGCGRASADRTAGEGGKDAVRIPREVLGQIERALGVAPERALALATEDALLAHELTRADTTLARSLATLGHARALLETLRADVAREEPARDSELETMARERWWEFERPRMVRVIHAVVRADGENAAAQALASRIREAVIETASPAEFRKAAEQIEAGGLNVQIETLPPIAPDGRSVDPAKPPPQGPPVRNMVPEFAAAASRLQTKGEVSPVVRSQFGFHVIQLLDVVPSKTVEPAERRARLADEVIAARVRKRTQDVLERLRSELSPEQSRAAVAAMEQVGSGS